MHQLESLEELRAYVRECHGIEPRHVFDDRLVHLSKAAVEAFDAKIDAVQAEIDARYMASPTDSEGVPVNVGDKLVGFYDRGDALQGFVESITYDASKSDGSPKWFAYIKGADDSDEFPISDCRHSKPRTPEEALSNMQTRVVELSAKYRDGDISSEAFKVEIRKSLSACADEIDAVTKGA